MNKSRPQISSLLLLLLIAVDVCALDTAYFAELLWQAKTRGDYLPDIYRIDPTVSEDQLYAIQRAYVDRQLADGDQVAGFKGGFIPKAPSGGVLLRSGLLSGAPLVKLNDFKLLVVEAEIGFRFCKTVNQRLADVPALKEVVCEIMPVMEIADGAIANFAEIKKDFKHLRSSLIAMNIASSHLLVGEAKKPNIDLATIAVSMKHDTNTIGSRNLDGAPDLWANILWVVNKYVIASGRKIEAGHIVIPGNLTGIHAAQVGEYVADFGELGRLSLTVR